MDTRAPSYKTDSSHPPPPPVGPPTNSFATHKGGDQTATFCGKLERHNTRSVGSVCHITGLPHSSQVVPLSDTQAFRTQSNKASKEKTSSFRRGFKAFRFGCHRTSSKSQLSRVLQPVIYGRQEVWRLQSHNRPQTTKRPCQLSSFQDGDNTIHSEVSRLRSVGHLLGLTGCLSPSNDASQITPSAKIRCRRKCLPIHRIMFRSVPESSSFHKGHEICGSVFPSKRCSHTHVSRRLADTSRVAREVSSRRTVCPRDSVTVRPLSERGKIDSPSHTTVGLFGSGDQSGSGGQSSLSGQARENTRLVSISSQEENSDSKKSVELPGPVKPLRGPKFVNIITLMREVLILS